MNKPYAIIVGVIWLVFMALMWKAMEKEEAKQCNGQTQFYVAFGKPYACVNWDQRKETP